MRWIVNSIFSAFCLAAVVDVLYRDKGLLLILMLPYILFELLQVVFLMTNKAPKEGASSVKEVIIPLLGTGWPILIGRILDPHLVQGHPNLLTIGILLLALVYAVLLATLLQIRYSFSILPEARSIVSTGLYRYVRHPLYSFYFVWAGLNIVLTADWRYGVFGLMPMIAFLTIRARIEERKLEANLEGYGEYRKRTGMFIPRIW